MLEGLPEKHLMKEVLRIHTLNMVGGYGIGARINQFLVLRDGIFDAVVLLNKEKR